MKTLTLLIILGLLTIAFASRGENYHKTLEGLAWRFAAASLTCPPAFVNATTHAPNDDIDWTRALTHHHILKCYGSDVEKWPDGFLEGIKKGCFSVPNNVICPVATSPNPDAAWKQLVRKIYQEQGKPVSASVMNEGFKIRNEKVN